MQDNAFKNKVKQVWAFIKRMAARVWAYLKVAKMEWIVLISLFAADLISKAIVEATLEYGDTATVIPYFLNVHRLHNYNAAFGSSWLKSFLGDIGARIFFSVFAVAASVAFVLVLIKNKGKSKWFRVAIAMFVAGAMGNCMDRMFLGYVRDFVEFVFFGQTWFGRTTWYVFNIADAELVAGVIMMIIYFLFMYRDSDKKKEHNELLTDELGEVEPIDKTAASAAKTPHGHECAAKTSDSAKDDSAEQTDGVSEQVTEKEIESENPIKTAEGQNPDNDGSVQSVSQDEETDGGNEEEVTAE